MEWAPKDPSKTTTKSTCQGYPRYWKEKNLKSCSLSQSTENLELYNTLKNQSSALIRKGYKSIFQFFDLESFSWTCLFSFMKSCSRLCLLPSFTVKNLWKFMLMTHWWPIVLLNIWIDDILGAKGGGNFLYLTFFSGTPSDVLRKSYVLIEEYTLSVFWIDYKAG